MLQALHARRLCHIWHHPEASSKLLVAKQQQPAPEQRWEVVKSCAQATAWQSRSVHGFCGRAEAAAAILLQALALNKVVLLTELQS